MKKRGTANFREQTCAVPSVMAGLHEHPGQERGAYGGARRRHRACQSLPDSGRIAERRTRRPFFPDGRRAAAPSKTGTRKGKIPLPCLVSGRAGRMDHGTGLSRPSPPWTDHAAGQKESRPAGRRTADKKDDRLPRGRSSRPKREDVLMVRGYGEGGGCSREPRQDQGGLPCRICCPPKAGRDDLRSKIRRSQEGPAGARGIPGRGRSSRGLHFVERELRLKVPVKGGCCFREPGRKEEELPARYFFLPLAGISS